MKLSLSNVFKLAAWLGLVSNFAARYALKVKAALSAAALKIAEPLITIGQNFDCRVGVLIRFIYQQKLQKNT